MAQTLHDPRMEQKGIERGADVASVNKLKMIGKLEDNYFLDQPKHKSQLEFFQYATGITDKRKLRHHIISIAKEAYDVFPYPCIWALYFCYTRVITHSAYQQVLKQATLDIEQERPIQPIFLDVGSFVGIDLRQVIYSGMNKDNVIGTDLIDGTLKKKKKKKKKCNKG
ncbi:hypothetical protein CROQUDRAFT_43792 [Cronartium quercuum f. sp. fusiforme G11]|uniref:Uncharacterized protein n=1 Tax=Cronartium quercuum f. sp. fusiforme G11 TaxID=708437 RepID=A0A9P6NJR7_9BASI|nr:hypothetical protein CROQUDRAFT_43792 [Cronartium quercuum f. sp. fusiforme G11]